MILIAMQSILQSMFLFFWPQIFHNMNVCEMDEKE